MNPTGVVTTVCGTGASGFANGGAFVARFHAPCGLAPYTDPYASSPTQSACVVVADTGTHRFRCVTLSTGQVRTFAGSDNAGFVHALDAASRFTAPHGVCAAGGADVVVSDATSVRLVRKGAVTLLAGGASAGFADSAAAAAKLSAPHGLVATSDGARVYVCDTANHRVRCVDLKTRDVRTACGRGEATHTDGAAANGAHATVASPHAIAFDRFAAKPESALLVTAGGGGAAGALRRLNLSTNQLTTVPVSVSGLQPHGVCVTPSGIALVSCTATHALYAVDPRTGATARIAGSGQSNGIGSADGAALTKAAFHTPQGLALHPNGTACVFVADSGNHKIRCVTLPAGLFGALGSAQVTGTAAATATAPAPSAATAAAAAMAGDTKIDAAGSSGTEVDVKLTTAGSGSGGSLNGQNANNTAGGGDEEYAPPEEWNEVLRKAIAKQEAEARSQPIATATTAAATPTSAAGADDALSTDGLPVKAAVSKS